MTEPDKANQEANEIRLASVFASGGSIHAIRLPKPVCVIGTIVYDDGSRHEFSALPGDLVTIDLRGDTPPQRVMRYER